jgi:hypothetical protein
MDVMYLSEPRTNPSAFSDILIFEEFVGENTAELRFCFDLNRQSPPFIHNPPADMSISLPPCCRRRPCSWFLAGVHARSRHRPFASSSSLDDGGPDVASTLETEQTSCDTFVEHRRMGSRRPFA